tara:strand:+ start:1454 stop:2104 length:651 start_codon:yes stop_codon:yes gene_type:complete
MVKNKTKSTKKEIIFYGSGSHLKVAAEIALLNNFKIKGVISDIKIKKNLFNISYLGNKDFLKKCNNKNFIFFVAIGENKLREKIFKMIKKKGFKFAKLIHPTAHISKSAEIKNGTIICAKSILNPKSSVGYNCIINTATLIEHDVNIKNHCHIAPGVKIGGGTIIGDRSFVGIGSIVLDNIKLAKDIIIGAGSIVIRDCLSKGTYIGRPARLKKSN